MMMKQLTDSVTAQAETLAALSLKINSGGGGKKIAEQGVYQNDGNFLELAANKDKRYAGVDERLGIV